MISIFRKKKDDTAFKPLLSGKLETNFDTLKSLHGEKLHGRIYDIDISDYTPEYVGILRVPKKIQQGIRDVLDDYLKENDDFYFQVDEKVFGLYFSKANKAVAELKVQVIRNELARVIETLKDKKTQEEPEVSMRSSSSPSPAKESQLPQRAELVNKGTLSAAPDEKEMRDWASRALANMSTQTGYLDFYADLERMAALVQVRYHPLWHTENKIISGYALETSATLTRKSYDEQRGHEDLALLGAAARQLSEMRERNEYALLIVPVHIHTICDQRTRNLYNIYCRTIGQDLQRFIVLQILGIGERSLTLSDWGALKDLRHHCRSMIIDTGASIITPENLTGFKFSTFGFNLRMLARPEDQLFIHLEKFASWYLDRKKHVFIMGVDSHSLLAASLGAGYSYVSGDAIAPAEAAPRAASFLNYEDVYQNILQ